MPTVIFARNCENLGTTVELAILYFKSFQIFLVWPKCLYMGIEVTLKELFLLPVENVITRFTLGIPRRLLWGFCLGGKFFSYSLHKISEMYVHQKYFETIFCVKRAQGLPLLSYWRRFLGLSWNKYRNLWGLYYVSTNAYLWT